MSKILLHADLCSSDINIINEEQIGTSGYVQQCLDYTARWFEMILKWAFRAVHLLTGPFQLMLVAHDVKLALCCNPDIIP